MAGRKRRGLGLFDKAPVGVDPVEGGSPRPASAPAAAPAMAPRSAAELTFETLEPRLLLSADNLTASEIGAITNGLASFRDLLQTLEVQNSSFSQVLPVVGRSTGAAVDVSNIIDENIVRPVSTYLGDRSSPRTMEGVAATLRAIDAVVGGTVKTSFADGEYLFLLSLRDATPTVSVEADLGGVVPDLKGVGRVVGSHLEVHGTLTMSDFGFGLRFANAQAGITDTVFVKPGSIEASVAAQSTDLDGEVQLGFVDARVTDGQADVKATARLRLLDPDNADSRAIITQAEWTGKPLSQLVQASLSGSASIDLPVTSSLLPSPQTLSVDWSTTLSPATAVSNIADLTGYRKLIGVDAAAVSGFLGKAADWLGRINLDDLLGNDLPIVGSKVGDIADVGAMLRELLIQKLPSFDSADTLLAALGKVQGLSNGTVRLADTNGDGKPDALFVDVDFAKDRTGKIDVDWTESGLIGLELDIDPIPATVRLGGHLAFGIDLASASPAFFLRTSDDVAVLSASVSLPQINGKGRIGPLNLSVAGGSANVAATVSLSKRGGGDRITAAEIAAFNGNVGDFALLGGTANLSLPLSATVLGASGNRTLLANWSDLGRPAALTINTADLGQMARFDGLSADWLGDAFKSLADWLRNLDGPSGVGFSLPVLGGSLGSIAGLGGSLADLFAQLDGIPSLDGLQNALARLFGTGTELLIGTDELRFVVGLDKAIDQPLSFALKQSLAALDLTVDGSFRVTGQASAKLAIGISLDKTKADDERFYIEPGADSVIDIAVRAATNAPFSAVAALGLVQMGVRGGTAKLGARDWDGTVDGNRDATLRLSLADPTSNGRITLRDLKSTPLAVLGPVITDGAIEVDLPLVSTAAPSGATPVPVNLKWRLDQPASAPSLTYNAAALQSLVPDPASLMKQGVVPAGLSALKPWLAGLWDKLEASPDFQTKLPLLNKTLAELIGFDSVFSAVANGILGFTGSPDFQAKDFAARAKADIEAAATASGATVVVNTARTLGGRIAAGDVTAAAQLGFPSDVERYVFNVAFDLKKVIGGLKLALGANQNDVSLDFQADAKALADLKLDLTFGFDMRSGLPVTDAIFMRVNTMNLGVDVDFAGSAAIDVGLGFLSAKASGAALDYNINLDVALAQQANRKAFVTLGQLVGASTDGLLDVSVARSVLDGTLPLKVSLAGLTGASGTVTIKGDPLDADSLDVDTTGTSSQDFNRFSQLNSGTVLEAIRQVSSWLGSMTQSSVFAKQIPLVAGSLSDVLKFGEAFEQSIVSALATPDGTPAFDTVSSLVAKLVSLAGGDPASVTSRYDIYSERLYFTLKLDQSFADLQGNLDYDLGSALAPFGSLVSDSKLRLQSTGRLEFTFGIDLAPGPVALTANNPLPSNGQLPDGRDAVFELSLAGLAPTTIRVKAAATADNASVDDFVADVNAALASAFRAAGREADLVVASAVGQQLTLTATRAAAGSTVMVSADSLDPSVTVLGFAGAASSEVVQVTGSLPIPSSGRLPSALNFQIAANGRSFSAIAVSAAETAAFTSSQQLVDLLNRKLAVANADLTAHNLNPILVVLDSTGCLRFETSGLRPDLAIQSAANSTATSVLGLPVSQLVKGGTVHQIGGSDLLERVFIDDLLARGDLKITGSLDAKASFGIVGVDIKGGRAVADGTAQLQLSGGRDVYYLKQLFAEADQLGTFLTGGDLTLSGTGALDLPVTVSGPLATLFNLPSTAKLTASATDLFQPSSWRADATQLDKLNDFGSVTADSLGAALEEFAQALETVVGQSILKQRIPLIDRSFVDVIGFVRDVSAAAKAFQANPATSLQGFEGRLNQLLIDAFGLPAGSDPVTVVVAPGGKDIRFDILLTPAMLAARLAPLDLALDLNLDNLGVASIPGFPAVRELLDARAKGQIRITPTAELKLSFGLDLTTPTSPSAYLHDGTALTLGLRAVADDLDLDLAVGPLGLYVRNGTALVSSAGDSSKPATIRLGMSTEDARDRYRLSDIVNGNVAFTGPSSPFVFQVDGRANADLPLFFPSETTPLKDAEGQAQAIRLNVGSLQTFFLSQMNGGDGGLTFSFPDVSGLTDIFANIGGFGQALDRLLANISDLLKGRLFNASLPLVGTQLADAADFIDTVRETLRVTNFAGAGVKTLLETIERKLGVVGDAYSDNPDLLKERISLSYVQQEGGTEKTYGRSDLPTSLNANDFVRADFGLILGDVWESSTKIGFDLGLPGLELEVIDQSALDVTLDWTLHLDFGVDRSGFYLLADGAEPEFSADLKAKLSPTFQARGRLGFLEMLIGADEGDLNDSGALIRDRNGNVVKRGTGFEGAFSADIAGTRVATTELPSAIAGAAVSFTGGAEANLDLDLAFGFEKQANGRYERVGEFPSLAADLHLDWMFGDGSLAGGTPHLSLNDIRLNFGEFLNDFVSSIFGPIKTVLAPVEPIVQILMKPLPLVSDLLGRKITMLDLARSLGYVSPSTVEFVKSFAQITDLINNLKFTGANSYIVLGDVTFGGGDGIDLRLNRGSGGGSLSASNPFDSLPELSVNTVAADKVRAEMQSRAGGFVRSADRLGSGLSFPILDNPKSVVGLLFGKQIDLVRLDLPELKAEFSQMWRSPTPVWPLPPIFINFGGKVGASAKFTFGYDTFGVTEYMRTNNSADIYKGLYIDDHVDANGNDRAELQLYGQLSVGASAFVAIAEVGARGGLEFRAQMNLRDPDADGKIRMDEFIDGLGGGPFCLFDVSGEVSAFLEVFWWVGFDALFGKVTLYEGSAELLRIKLLDLNFPQCEQPPILATLEANGNLILNVGDRAALRGSGTAGVTDENYTVSSVAPGIVKVEAVLDGEHWEAYYGGKSDIYVKTITGDGGSGKDRIVLADSLPGRSGPIRATLRGGDGDDTLVGGGGGDLIIGGAGTDDLSGGGGDDRIFASSDTSQGSANETDTIRGGAGADLIYGSLGANAIWGDLGDDTLYGGGGNDSIRGGLGNDALHGGEGTDQLRGEDDEDALFGGAGSDLLIGGAGRDRLVGGWDVAGIRPTLSEEVQDATAAKLFGAPAASDGNDFAFGEDVDGNLVRQFGKEAQYRSLFGIGVADFETLVLRGDGLAQLQLAADIYDGGAGDDVLLDHGGRNEMRGGTGADLIVGGIEADTIDGQAGLDRIAGRAGDDLVRGGADADQIDGGAGMDRIFGEAGDDVILGGLGLDLLYGGLGNDELRGQEGDDEVYGSAGNDRLFGDDGRDLVLGEAGDDSLEGGVNDDILSGGEGKDSLWGQAGDDLLEGGAGNDRLSGSFGRDRLRAGSGTDALFGEEDDDELQGDTSVAATLSGGAGNDLIIGADLEVAVDKADLIYGGLGDDRIFGRAGADRIYAEGGNDVVYAGSGADLVVGGAGRDVIYGERGADTLHGHGPGSVADDRAADEIYGGLDNDTITGGGGDDHLDGGHGADNIGGDAGNDAILAGFGTGDALRGDDGDDVITGSDEGADDISGGAGRDRIFGMRGNDSILGGADDDILEGGAGNDRIQGEGGRDLIVGGADHDVLYGFGVDGDGATDESDLIFGDLGTGDAKGGNDLIYGGAGTDRLFGEGGDDLIEPGAGTGDLVDYGGGGDVAGTSGQPTVTSPTPGDPNAWRDPADGATLPTSVPVGVRWTVLSGRDGLQLSEDATTLTGSVRVAADRTGNRFVAWVDTRNGGSEIYVAVQSASGWRQLSGSAEHGGLSSTGTPSFAPAIAVGSDGQPIVAWIEETASGREIRALRYDATAGRWVALGSSLAIGATGAISDLKLVQTDRGPAVVWRKPGQGGDQLFARLFDGQAWVEFGSGSATTGITAAAGGVLDFAVTSEGGKVAIAFTSLVSGVTQVSAQTFDGTSWAALGAAGAVSSLSGGARAPSIAYLNGTLFVAYEQLSGPFGEASSVQVKQLRGSSWLAAGATAQASSPGETASTPALASGGGKMHLVYQVEGTVDGPGRHLYARVWNGTTFIEEIPGDASGPGIAQGAGSVENLSLAVDWRGRPVASFTDGAGGVQVLANLFAINRVFAASGAAQVQAILDAQDLGAGDVIVVAEGTSSGPITIGAADSGVTLLGTRDGSTINGTVTIQGATQVTLKGLTLAGLTATGASGLALVDNRVTGSLSLTGGSTHQIFGNVVSGGVVLAGAAGVALVNNTITGGTALRITGASSGSIRANTLAAGGGTALSIEAAFTGLIASNRITGSALGVRYAASAALSGNEIFGNATGLRVELADAKTAFGFVAGSGSNRIRDNGLGVDLQGRMQGQEIRNNAVGVSGEGILGGTSLTGANRIVGNTVGVTAFKGDIQYNRIGENGRGVVAGNGQRIFFNVFYRNVEVGLLADGVEGIRTANNTFYAPTGDNIRVVGGSRDVEIRSSILWAASGYDIYVANDSQRGFFSDYNTLHATGTGKLVFWTKTFTDILDWQVDVGRFDLHSVGRTAINPTLSEPAFVDRGSDDFRILGTAAGQRTSGLAVDGGDPLALRDTALMTGNLLANPGFEQGTIRWTVSGMAVTSAAPYSGSQALAAGSTDVAYAEQTVDLVASGLSVADLDRTAGGSLFDMVFGARVKGEGDFGSDHGSVVLTFRNASGAVLATHRVDASDPADRWDLVGRRVEVPTGARSVTLRLEAVQKTGSSNDVVFDATFLSLLPEARTVAQGAHAAETVESSSSGPRIALRTPDLYVDWERAEPHTIAWETFGNTKASPVRITLWQDQPDGPRLVRTLATSVPDTGSYVWTPAESDIAFGTKGLRIQIQLIGQTAVVDRSVEAFTVPEEGKTYWVDDGSNTGDKFSATAIGSNRNTGKAVDAPKSNLVNLFRTYNIGAGSVVNVDTGSYAMINPLKVSGSTDFGLGLDEGFTIRGSDLGTVSLYAANSFDTPDAIVELDDADFVTLQSLSLSRGHRGLWVHDDSNDLGLARITAFSNTQDGIRIEGTVSPGAFSDLRSYSNGADGLFLSGSFGSIRRVTTFRNGGDGVEATGAIALLTDVVSYANAGYGVSLTNPGNLLFVRGDIYSNRGYYGLTVTNSVSGATARIGDSNLSNGRGVVVRSNAQSGVSLSGNVAIAGSSIFGHLAANEVGLELSGNAGADANVIFSNTSGIKAYGGVTLSGNRVYRNTGTGIEIGSYADGVAVQRNVVYSNGAGILDASRSSLMSNNLVYANTQYGMWFSGGSHEIVNNTIYQASGLGLRIGDGASNNRIRSNIIWTEVGAAVTVDGSSQNGFASDFNILRSGRGPVGIWQGVARPTLANWRSATLQDGHSLAQDPAFVDADGADGKYGYVSASSDGRDDNFHIQSPFGSLKAGSLAPVYSAETKLPFHEAGALSKDATRSPALDRADPADGVGAEPTPNGGYREIGAYGGTAQASRSPDQYVLLTSPNGGEVFQQRTTATIEWRSFGFTGAVNLAYSTDGVTFATLATNVANTGRYTWSIDPAKFAASQTYTLRIRSAANTSLSDVSDAVFRVEPRVTRYYVNDGSRTGDEYTTAIGSDANDGRSADRPMASLAALLRAYDLDAGDVVYIDTGVYGLSRNVVIGAEDGGTGASGQVRFQGPTGSGHAAVLDRGNTASGTAGFELSGADWVSLANLQVRGGEYGIVARDNADSDGLEVVSSRLSGFGRAAIRLGAGTGALANGGAVISGVTIVGPGGNASYALTGIEIASEGALVRNSAVSGVGYGVNLTNSSAGANNRVEGSRLFGNYYYGGYGYGTFSGNTVYGNGSSGLGVLSGLAAGNTVYGHDQSGASGIDLTSGNAQARGNVVYGNTVGIELGNGSRASGNRVYGNTVGIEFGYGAAVVEGNRIYSNATGIGRNSSYTTGTFELRNNLIYGNTNAGLAMRGVASLSIGNNTFYQSVGTAVALEDGVKSAQIGSNIFWLGGTAFALDVAADSQVGLRSNDNLFYRQTTTARIAKWGELIYADGARWYYGTGQDHDSQTADPRFVDPNGADNALGYTQTGGDKGADDDFHLLAGSPGIDRAGLERPFYAEPVPGGDRAELGAYGNTAEATGSPAKLLQLLGPTAFDKVEVGQAVQIAWRSAGLTLQRPVYLMNAGGEAIMTSGQGRWLAGLVPAGAYAYAVNGAIDLSRANTGPEALYRNVVEANTSDRTLGYAVPVANGSYTLRLHFLEPSYDAGTRIFDILVNGKVVRAGFDIAAAAGGRMKAVTLDLAVAASGGQGLSVSLRGKSPSPSPLLSGIELLAANAAGTASPTVTLQSSLDAGKTWTTVRSGLALNRYGEGSYTWTPGAAFADKSVTFRVVTGTVSGVSAGALQVANAGRSYYVNDGSLTGDEYTTAIGNDLNSGKTADRPMASLAALLRAYDLDAGDVVYIDTGVYGLSRNVVIGAEDGGTGASGQVRFQGPTGSGHAAVLDRGNTASGTAGFELSGADWVSLANLQVRGGEYGIVARDNADSDGLEVVSSRLSGFGRAAIRLGAGTGALANGGAVISGVTIVGPGGNASYALTGIEIASEGALVRNSAVSGVGYGVNLTNSSAGANNRVEGSRLFGNYYYGGYGYGTFSGNTVYGNGSSGLGVLSGLAAGNTVYGHDQSGASGIDLTSGNAQARGNVVYGNTVGIELGNGSRASGNRVYGNTVGIEFGYGAAVVEGNRIYSNATGIGRNSSYTTGTFELRNNLIYGNTNAGLAMRGVASLSIGNNTFYQSVGTAVALEDGVKSAVLRNNIFWSDVGKLLDVAADSTAGVDSDYNVFYRGPDGTATIGTWGAASAGSFASWRSLTGGDGHSREGNPGFVDIAGADNALGYTVGGGDKGADDNFSLRRGSIAIDAGEAYRAPATDSLGRPRANDLGTADAGIGWARYAETQSATSVFNVPVGGTLPGVAQNFRTSGSYLEYALPFAFSIYGQSFTKMLISSEGYVQFAGNDSAGSPDFSEAVLARNLRLIAFGTDLSTLSGDVFISSNASAVTIRWQATIASTGGPANFAITLNANGSFRFDYGDGNASPDVFVGVTSGDGLVLRSTYAGRASLARASSMVWSPVAGETMDYYDIGALEFQGNSADKSGPKITSVPSLPAKNGTTTNSVSSIVINISEPLDLISATSEANYRLIGAGQDGVFETADDILVRLVPSYRSAEKSLKLELQDGALAEGLYRLTVSGTRALVDTAGNPLDGNGDGVAGDDYVHTFTVAGGTASRAMARSSSGNSYVMGDAPEMQTLAQVYTSALAKPQTYELEEILMDDLVSPYAPAASRRSNGISPVPLNPIEGH